MSLSCDNLVACSDDNGAKDFGELINWVASSWRECRFLAALQYRADTIGAGDFP